MKLTESYANRVALYVRASTEHQNYSTRHQEAALRDYATNHRFEVCKIYRDEGRSGLTLGGRIGLLQLLSDVQSGKADFRGVLVYDVSRWGRFQDIDESAYYEYACRKSGIDVVYCTEPFDNDGSPLATVLKSLRTPNKTTFLHSKQQRRTLSHPDVCFRPTADICG
jgi:DNA invertase Pin-like site-specific DNA recombinase